MQKECGQERPPNFAQLLSTFGRIIRLAEEEGGALHHPIVLMHNQPAGNPATVAALPAVIQYFRAHGYRFVAL